MKAIHTVYHGPTNTRGSRIYASDLDGNKVVVSYDSASSDPHRDAAVALCRKMGWTGKLISADEKRGKVFVFLPHDVLLAHRGRVSCDVIDLSQTEGGR